LQNLFGKGNRLRYLCQDEMRVGLKTETRRVITACGVKPMLNVEWKRDNFWVYGVVEPLNGWHFEQEYAHLNSEHFQSFLDALSTALGDDRALIQLDQAKAHQALSLRWPENLIPVLQPAHSPELNPTERFWQQIKSHLKGEHFATLAQLRQRLSQILADLLPEQVASLTSYEFILEALFYAAL
jgi:quinol monooxygenase YgiN